MRTRTPDERSILRPIFQLIYDDAHTHLQTKLVTKMKVLEALYIRQCTDILSGLLSPATNIYKPDGKVLINVGSQT